jgi:hypothetical protein
VQVTTCKSPQTLVDPVNPMPLIVRRDNDPSRDMKPAGIVRSIRNFEAAGMPVPDQMYILNHWR